VCCFNGIVRDQLVQKLDNQYIIRHQQAAPAPTNPTTTTTTATSSSRRRYIRVWHDTTILVIITMRAYFCFLDAILFSALMDDLKFLRILSG
jgi:hypothetical protein